MTIIASVIDKICFPKDTYCIFSVTLSNLTLTLDSFVMAPESDAMLAVSSQKEGDWNLNVTPRHVINDMAKYLLMVDKVESHTVHIIVRSKIER